MDDDEHVTLGRIDERVKHIQASIIAVKLELDRYVLHVRFRPVEMLVYGLTSIILAAVIAALVALVVK